MSVVILALLWALQIYFWLLISRFIVDLVLSSNPVWRPKGIILVLVEITMTATDPPLKFVRKFIKPIRFGALALDFGWTLTLLAVTMLQNLLSRLL
jgi:YggT family protein